MEPELYIVTYPWNTEYAEAALTDDVKYDYDRVERCPLCVGEGFRAASGCNLARWHLLTVGHRTSYTPTAVSPS